MGRAPPPPAGGWEREMFCPCRVWGIKAEMWPGNGTFTPDAAAGVAEMRSC